MKDIDLEAPNKVREDERRLREWLGKFTIITNKFSSQTEEYKTCEGRMYYARIAYVIFIFALPIVFRYSFYSSVTRIEQHSTYIPIGNGTIEMQSSWGCTDCEDLSGETNILSIIK